MEPHQNSENTQQGQPVSASPSPEATPSAAPAVENHTLLAVLSYIGPLVIISYLVGKDIPFVKFHVKQGLVLFAIEIIVWILGSVMYSVWMLLNIVNLVTLVLSIIGIINVIQHKEKALPLVGSLSTYFKF